MNKEFYTMNLSYVIWDLLLKGKTNHKIQKISSVIHAMKIVYVKEDMCH